MIIQQKKNNKKNWRKKTIQKIKKFKKTRILNSECSKIAKKKSLKNSNCSGEGKKTNLKNRLNWKKNYLKNSEFL